MQDDSQGIDGHGDEDFYYAGVSTNSNLLIQPSCQQEESDDVLNRGSGTKKRSQPDEVRYAIVELYLNVKIRSADEIKNLDEEQLEVERRKLQAVDSLVILDFVKQSVEILMEMRKTEFDDYEKNHAVKKRIQINVDKREKEEAAKSSGIKVEDQKE